jgi:hypothetical protein
MAVYKVPQDVEADDKLIGPFSFRQFIYLIIVAASCAIAWVLGNIFIGLAIIPLPLIIFFGALALPLRKDQPMETYLAAIVSFYLKPRKRLWDPDGQLALVEITAPKIVEVRRYKDLSEGEAEKRLTYLAGIVDSHGWSLRGVSDPSLSNGTLNSNIYDEAEQALDILDVSNQTSSQIDSRLDQSNVRHRQDLVSRMAQPAPQQTIPAVPPQAVIPVASPQAQSTVPQPPVVPDPYAALPQQSNTQQPVADDAQAPLTINPYPAMQQSVIQPASSQPVVETPPNPETTSEKPPSADIMNLANNPDLSIETIAHEAQRIKEKEGLPEEEVVVSLH